MRLDEIKNRIVPMLCKIFCVQNVRSTHLNKTDLGFLNLKQFIKSDQILNGKNCKLI